MGTTEGRREVKRDVVATEVAQTSLKEINDKLCLTSVKSEQ